MLFKTKHNSRYSPSEILLFSLSVLCFLYSLYIAIRYANQAPLDLYSFRQTQTALTAYWLVKDGFRLAYETPVFGPPWTIPFECPAYQYIVALVTTISGLSLDAVGRVVSFIFLALCLIPVRSITKSLTFPRSIFYIFTALFFSSPVYLYWGRTFMIETAALFFAVVAVKYFVDIVQVQHSYTHHFLFVICITLSILQKATTGLPVLAVLCFVYLFVNIKEANSLKSVIISKKTILALIYFGLPLAIGVTWVLYTDHIKALSELGGQLTSAAISSWNWGTLRQRLSSSFYSDVIWQRVFQRNLSGTLGIAILMIALFSNAKNHIKFTLIVSSLMGLVPLFLFTNLHIVHDYYQTANVIFLIYAVAVSLGCVLNNYFGEKLIVFPLIVLMLTSNYCFFAKDYLGVVKTVFNDTNSRDYAISKILKKEIPQGKYFVAFGNDWSSSFSYLSERKSLTATPWLKQYERIAINPEQFIQETDLGAVVICTPVRSPTINDLIRWSSTGRKWKIGEVFGCYIATPEALPVDEKATITHAECQGSIDFADEVQAGNQKLFSVTGWISIPGEKGSVPEMVYVTLTKKDSQPIYLETLQVNRADVNAHCGQPNCAYSGFSRIVSADSFAGKYVLGVAILNKGHLESCQLQKEVLINGPSLNE